MDIVNNILTHDAIDLWFHTWLDSIAGLSLAWLYSDSEYIYWMNRTTARAFYQKSWIYAQR